ncbi:RDD family protein [Cellulomonas fimi]|uniref:RDD family protein n=1 Tax=Cellulomonas fimi TaxID=1708 RepID=UPI00234E3645|nr:RDD family protein [Cellulomonas fimi]MDC7122663.1 RDD family protein [Cellulomonas fimi]
MTVPVLLPPAVELDPTPPYASWSRRVVAALLDSAVLGAVTWFAVGDGYASPTLQPTFDPGATPQSTGTPWTSSLVLVGALLAMLVLQGLTGQTPGRRAMGVAVVRATPDGLPLDERPGVLRSVGRWLAHLLDAILLIGYLRPLWHRERQTFADGLARTVVVRRPRWPTVHDTADVGRRRRGRAVTVGAYVLVVVGVLAGVRWGESGGTERLAQTPCVRTAQTSGLAVTVDSADLVVDREWTRDARLWPRPAGGREDGPTTVAIELSWQDLASSGDPSRQLQVRTTTAGGTSETSVDVTSGWTRVPVERAGGGTVDVEVLVDGTPLTSCSATVPAVPGDAGGGQE